MPYVDIFSMKFFFRKIQIIFYIRNDFESQNFSSLSTLSKKVQTNSQNAIFLISGALL